MPDTNGLRVIFSVCGELVPQPFPAVTLIVPGAIAAEIVTKIEVVPCPETIVIPGGVVHV